MKDAAPPPPAPEAGGRLARLSPWLAGLVGALVFLRPLRHAPASTLLDRVFSYDGFVNIGDLAALHRNLAQGPLGRGLHDWLYDAPFFFPQPRALVTSELMPLAALVTWPLGSEAVLSNNVLLFATSVLNCVAGTSFARSLGARATSSLVAGLAFAFSAYTNFQSGRVQLLFLFPLAFALGATWRFVRDGRTRDAVATGGWVLCSALLCLYYTVFLGLALPVVAVAGRLALPRPGARRDLARLAGTLALMLAPAAVLLWPYRGLRSSLGLARPMSELGQQSGDAMMFLWADASTLPGRLLPDVYKWDSAYFPGVVVLLASLAGLLVWVRRERRERLPVVAVLAAGALLAPLATINVFHLALLAALVMTVRLARRGRCTPLAPTLLALVAVGLFVFGGPWPRVWDRPLGTSAYAALFQFVPFIDGLRMVRRAGLLVNLALSGVAALALDRVALRSRGSALVGLCVLVTFVEGMPLALGVVEAPRTCSDLAYRTAHEMGTLAVADLSSVPLLHSELARRRHEATVCDVATTLGPPGFVPLVAEVANEAARSLPSPQAHAWLWDAGLRTIVLRGGMNSTFAAERVRRLAGITAEARVAGPDRVVALLPPALMTTRPPAHLEGQRLPVLSVSCDRGVHCAAAADGDESTRWGTGTPAQGGETVTLRLDPATVTGLEWHATGCATDLPRGLRIEREAAPGVWELWAEFASLSPIGLGRDAVHPSFALALPPARTAALRLTALGSNDVYWVGASELVVRGGP